MLILHVPVYTASTVCCLAFVSVPGRMAFRLFFFFFFRFINGSDIFVVILIDNNAIIKATTMFSNQACFQTTSQMFLLPSYII